MGADMPQVFVSHSTNRETLKLLEAALSEAGYHVVHHPTGSFAHSTQVRVLDDVDITVSLYPTEYTVGVRELNQHTSAVLKRVREGTPVTVTERGTPVAHLIPAQPAATVLDQMVASGRATAPSITGPVPLPPIFGDPAVNSADELIAAREEERW